MFAHKFDIGEVVLLRRDPSRTPQKVTEHTRDWGGRPTYSVQSIATDRVEYGVKQKDLV